MTARLFYFPDVTDRRLVELIREGDRAAFDAAYRKYWEALFNAAYKRLNDRAATEEVVQELFVHLYQIRETLDPDLQLAPYLHGALRNRILNHLRAQARRLRHTRIAALRTPSPENPEESFSYKALQEALAGALRQMPAKYRDVYVLNRQESLTVREAAAKLGISEARAEKYLRKALILLRRALGSVPMAVAAIAFLFRK